jgi:tRNA-specific 2-thiouridylase
MSEKNGRLVVLGMSGGVDSSVSLMELKNAGYKVVGVSLKYDIWECADRSENVCCSKESFENAKKVCEHFGSEHKVIDVSGEFKKEVIDYFKSELSKNRTPSPCVMCNPKVKFKSLLDYADQIGAQFVATGHYARINKNKDQFELHRAKYLDKDQTYSLSFLTQAELSKIIFPLGELSKSEVYDLAKGNEVLKLYKNIKQSQDFCFLGKDQLNEFISSEIVPKSGKIIELDGEVLGEHKGLPYYTIGQRKGIELPGGPYYVVGKDIENNELIVSKDEEKLLSKEVHLKPYNLINEIKLPVKVEAKLRSAQDLFKAELSQDGDFLILKFNEPQKSATEGQIAVFYSGDMCLGSGVIDRVIG